MNNIATMFLSELTIVDHAYITEHGAVVGGSFNPSFKVSGEVDPVENVVVDFSTIKKQLKSFIDDDKHGFDHKLWIISGLSSVVRFEVGETICEDVAELMILDDKCLITVHTPLCSLTIPRDAIKFIGYEEDLNCNFMYNTANAGEWMERYLNVQFNGVVTVECNNTEHAHVYTGTNSNPIEFFRYDHGLKKSTSFGCQNPCHGHLSFLQLECNAPIDEQTKLLITMTDALDGLTFINTENVVRVGVGSVDIEYTSSNRGVMKASYKINSNTYGANFVVLNTETTAEHLVDYVIDNFREELINIGATGLYLSEGLSKGTFATIKE